MQYTEALAYFQNALKRGIKPGLSRVRTLLAELGHPERQFRAIQVAGTNGKGSCAAIVARALTLSGERCGLFTTPAVLDYREQISVDGAWISKEDFARLTGRVQAAAARVAGLTGGDAQSAAAPRPKSDPSHSRACQSTAANITHFPAGGSPLPDSVPNAAAASPRSDAPRTAESAPRSSTPARPGAPEGAQPDFSPLPESAEALYGAPTEFELVTALGFLFFAECGCTVAVVEAGLGGLGDATNVLPRTEVAVLTRIGLDHTAILGSTLTEIARQKCGIIKPGCTVVSAPAQRPEAAAEIRAAADALGRPLLVPGEPRAAEDGFSPDVSTPAGSAPLSPAAQSAHAPDMRPSRAARPAPSGQRCAKMPRPSSTRRGGASGTRP